MRLVRRQLAPEEIDYELVVLMTSVASLGLAVWWFAFHLPWPICWFHALTGRPCATCGATRGAIAFFHGDLLGAMRWNPLAFGMYCGIAAFDAYAFGVLVTRVPRLRISFNAAEKQILRGLAVAMLLANWAYLLLHTANF